MKSSKPVAKQQNATECETFKYLEVPITQTGRPQNSVSAESRDTCGFPTHVPMKGGGGHLVTIFKIAHSRPPPYFTLTTIHAMTTPFPTHVKLQDEQDCTYHKHTRPNACAHAHTHTHTVTHTHTHTHTHTRARAATISQKWNSFPEGSGIMTVTPHPGGSRHWALWHYDSNLQGGRLPRVLSLLALWIPLCAKRSHPPRLKETYWSGLLSINRRFPPLRNRRVLLH